MTDIRALKTSPELLSSSSAVTSFLSITAGLPLVDALESSSCHLEIARDVLNETASNRAASSSHLYAVLTSVEIAKGLLDAAVTAILRDGKEVRHG
ncbi:hypothetical protein [Burkholderia multivorans]|uniref:hypothetical protein n=1 Tax=Burkholderia multivorans TaxID=87883 RepID=UPI000F79A91A|nr:hypothetical protein [Burkholderia multivorans]MDR8918496.1 hypothetical protein [Burkholderia multivorans]MDR8924222.1 hypothetical protein [Burkholderia multivorans]MDR8969172.1 hypothetical protein [Burkholderia multivorans]MDR8993126.1 hypothetical protein [Burkholderia multivorans]MDR9023827.1 hypothetical protein [Burkholderia multivorans]